MAQSLVRGFTASVEYHTTRLPVFIRTFHDSSNSYDTQMSSGGVFVFNELTPVSLESQSML